MMRMVHLPQTISAVAHTGQVLLSFVAVAMRFLPKGTARLQLLKYRNPFAGGAVEVAPRIQHATGRDEGLLPRAEAVVGHPAAIPLGRRDGPRLPARPDDRHGRLRGVARVEPRPEAAREAEPGDAARVGAVAHHDPLLPDEPRPPGDLVAVRVVDRADLLALDHPSRSDLEGNGPARLEPEVLDGDAVPPAHIELLGGDLVRDDGATAAGL